MFWVWVLNVLQVVVFGDFNGWWGGVYCMQVFVVFGIWELLVLEVVLYSFYCFEIINCDIGDIFVKFDFYVCGVEL